MGSHSRVLVTGAGGQAGLALRTQLPGARFLTHEDLDVRDLARARDVIRGADVVIHLAAMTNVDECERNPELAFEVNGEGTKNVVGVAREFNARVLYVSTDYVFDGSKQEPYAEEDSPSPINAYGHSKLQGEAHTQSAERNLIVRTSWVYGQGRNFIRTILDAMKNRPRLRVVDDQRGRPTHADDLARALARLAYDDTRGILHVTGDGPACSWADLAAHVIALTGGRTEVERIDSHTFAAESDKVVASRPVNSELALRRARSLGFDLRDWRDAVQSYVEQLT